MTDFSKEAELDKILKQYSTDVQRGMAEIGLGVAKEALQRLYNAAVAEAELDGYKRGIDDEIKCVENSGEHFDLRTKLQTPKGSNRE